MMGVVERRLVVLEHRLAPRHTFRVHGCSRKIVHPVPRIHLPTWAENEKKINICLCKVGSWGLVQLSVWYRSFDSRSRKGLRLIFCTESLNCLWDLAQNQEHFEYCNNPCTFRLNKLLFKDNILDLIKNKMKN